MTCIHHWLVESPDGSRGELPGKCKHCGEERMFPNEANDFTGFRQYQSTGLATIPRPSRRDITLADER